MTPRVSVVIPVYNEGDSIVTCLDRLVDTIALPCEILVVYDTPEDTTRPYAEKYDARRATAAADPEHARTRPRVRDRYGIEHTTSAPTVVVTMADGSDDPTQVDALARLIERGMVVAAASRYMPGGRQIDAPWLKRCVLAVGGSHAVLVRAGRHPRRHELVQGVRPGLRAGGRHGVDHRLHACHRARGQGPAPPAARGRDPDDLAGANPGCVELQDVGVVSSALPTGTSTHSVPRSPSARGRTT